MKLGRYFANVVKKPRMELTIRTPYKTLFQNFSDFKYLKTKTPESVLVVGNRMPPALYLLPPGNLSVKPLSESKDFKGEFIHMGGWLIIHADNTTECFLMDAVERKDFQPARNENLSSLTGEDPVAAKYIESIRKEAQSAFFKAAS